MNWATLDVWPYQVLQPTFSSLYNFMICMHDCISDLDEFQTSTILLPDLLNLAWGLILIYCLVPEAVIMCSNTIIEYEFQN